MRAKQTFLQSHGENIGQPFQSRIILHFFTHTEREREYLSWVCFVRSKWRKRIRSPCSVTKWRIRRGGKRRMCRERERRSTGHTCNITFVTHDSSLVWFFGTTKQRNGYSTQKKLKNDFPSIAHTPPSLLYIDECRI